MSLVIIDGQRSELQGVPPHWNKTKMRKAVGQYQLEKNNDPLPVVLSLTKKGVRVKKDLNFGKSAENYIGHQIADKGQFVFTPRDFDATPILCGLSPTRGCISNLYLVFDVAKDIDPRFLEYYFWGLKYGYDYFAKLSNGMRFSFNREQFERIPLVHPDLEEQKSIVHYLDQTTTKIDAMIEGKSRFILLLKEKREATISHFVTKGLDHNVPMQQTNIDWIGDIPVSWKLTKLGYLGRCANGINIGGDSFGSGFPFVSYGDVYNNRELPGQITGLVESTKADRIAYSVKSGDILFTRTSETVEEIAFPSICIETIQNAVFAGFLIRFRPFSGVLVPRFSKYAFQNKGLRAFFVKEMKLVTRASLSQGLLRNMPVALPPMKQQEKIAEYLEEADAKFEALITKTMRSIDLLKEKRSALITAAVTGKTDVRSAS